MKFSERIGATPVRTALQVDSMDDALRNSLWNVFHVCVIQRMERHVQHGRGFPGMPQWKLFHALWWAHFKAPLDTLADTMTGAINQVRTAYFRMPWHQVYDFIEFVGRPEAGGALNTTEFRHLCNVVLEGERSGFRFVGDEIAPFTNQEEISSVEQAIMAGGRLAGVQPASSRRQG